MSFYCSLIPSCVGSFCSCHLSIPFHLLCEDLKEKNQTNMRKKTVTGMNFLALLRAVGITVTNGKKVLIYKSYEPQAGTWGRVNVSSFGDRHTLPLLPCHRISSHGLCGKAPVNPFDVREGCLSLKWNIIVSREMKGTTGRISSIEEFKWASGYCHSFCLHRKRGWCCLESCAVHLWRIWSHDVKDECSVVCLALKTLASCLWFSGSWRYSGVKLSEEGCSLQERNL